MRFRKLSIGLFCLLGVLVLVLWWFADRVTSPTKASVRDEAVDAVETTRAQNAAIRPESMRSLTPAERSAVRNVSDAKAKDKDEESPQTEEEKAEAVAEAKVEAFDNLTDKWMEPSKQGVSMKDVDGFVSMFRAVPKDRKDECIHRALNLIPDENVMLLAGVLMDKSEDNEIVETVFNDILNRDEDVKKPILKQILADKTHPCWADTAWILDVTGELPAKK